MRRVPLNVRRMLPVFIGLFIIVYSLIVITKYTKFEGNDDDRTAIHQTTSPSPTTPTKTDMTKENEKPVNKYQQEHTEQTQQNPPTQKGEDVKAYPDDKEEEEEDDETAKKTTGTGSAELRRTHVFYYPWYANLETDGAWNHWNHRVLEHWNPETARRYLRNVNYVPPEDIGCNYYPLLGPYSSMDDKVISEHMRKLKDYVVVVSWWGRPDVKDAKDGEGYSTDSVMPKLFKAAEKVGAKIAFHLEPYPCKEPAQNHRTNTYFYFFNSEEPRVC